MCNCKQEVAAKFKEFYPDAEYINGQYEILSGRAYADYEIKLPDKKKPISKMLLYSYCPHCGIRYEPKEDA